MSKKSIWDDDEIESEKIKAKTDNIIEVLNKLKYKQLQALARYHNLHYKIKLVGKQNLINAISSLYDYKNGIYSLKEKPFEMILKDDNNIKQVINVKRKNINDKFVIDLIKKQGADKTIQDIIKQL